MRAATDEVELEYPLAFAAAMNSILTENKTPFRYMHVSGVMAEKDQEKPLWFLQEGRRTKVHDSDTQLIAWKMANLGAGHGRDQNKGARARQVSERLLGIVHRETFDGHI